MGGSTANDYSCVVAKGLQIPKRLCLIQGMGSVEGAIGGHVEFTRPWL